MPKKTPQSPADDPKKRQAALDAITAEELEKVKAHQASTKGAFPVDQEWLLLAEFAMKFGWEAYQAARTDQIDIQEMLTLIEASRKLEWAQLYNDSRAALIGAGSANSKKPSQTFTALTSDIINHTKVDEP